MTTRHSPTSYLIASCIVILATVSAQAQDRLLDDDAIATHWKSALETAAKTHGMTLVGDRLQASDAEKESVYRDAIDRLMDTADRGLQSLDTSIVREAVREKDREWIERVARSGVESRVPTATDSRSTNPVTRGLTERSGLTELLALALNGQSVVSGDATAVSISLNALALVSLSDPDVYSELYRYQQHGLVRRFGGTVTLGSKIPEKEITGLSSLPDFDKLFNAVGWDVKVRLAGDKDPRSARWYPLTVGRGGDVNQINSVILGLVPLSDVTLVQRLLDGYLDRWLTALKKRVARSAQLTAKAAGTHLTTESGKNKYSGALLFDVGLGASDLTANGSYTVTQGVSSGSNAVYTIKRVDLSAELTWHLADGAFADRRTVDWSLGSAGTVFMDKASIPVAANNTWKVYSTLEVPLGKTAKLPFSLVYSNDPNALTKSKYVSGLVGLSYDFSALGQLFSKAQ